MDVKNSLVNGNTINAYAVIGDGDSAEDFINNIEEIYSKMGLDYNSDEFAEVRNLVESLKKMNESNKTSSDYLKKELIAHKKKIAENMIKTIRMLNSKTYTSESWKKAMADVSKAAKMFKGGEMTSSQLNKIIRQLRVAMSKLRPAMEKSRRGDEKHRKKALSDIDGKAFYEKDKAEESSLSAYCVDFTIDSAADAEVLESSDFTIG